MVNRILNRIDLILNELFMKIYTIFVYIECKLKNIEIENNNKFYGRLKIFKSNNSMISIGHFNVFRSGKFSNLIGVNRPCIISTLSENANLKIGNNSGFSGTVINCFLEIKIGNNVMVGANTLIMDGDWHQEDNRSGVANPIIIGNNVWIGEGVKILKGVTIGENSVIGAGSIVTRNIPSNVFAAGNPCKVIRNLND